MELHLHSHHFTHRMPDWRAAVWAGAIAGAVFLLLGAFLMAVVTEQDPRVPPHMIAAIILGRGAMQSAEALPVGIVVAALVVHFALAVLFAVILSVIIASFSLDSSLAMASLAGLAFGLGIYLINFYGMTRFFPWFAEARNWANVLAHIVFGVVAAGAYMRLERKVRQSGESDTGDVR
ncbi:hypothetical protein SAMN05192539_1010105 [Paraburkholderia diazotrophica]|uniref:Sodium:proline symporter n=2 Tax=Paraburkholderia diazotrophica TaxID=667676 RepID=A0A1H6YEV4_9BURK|nr:hypothetical protein [Paraburkholderia diazotrophica]SEJ39813.1 hypothetical protein SAMN05192539_1010105 [Paraburkholderia diazotrophica]